MKNLLIRLLGCPLSLVETLLIKFKVLSLYEKLGRFGQDSSVAYPFNIIGAENLEIGNDVSIGNNSTIYCTRAKCVFRDHSFTGPNLTIITGNHAFWPESWAKHCYKRLLDDISMYDAPVEIKEDVWIGANVTILKGVTIERGAIVAAGSVVTNDVQPYSIVAGVPAKFIKFKWDPEEISHHEKALYDKHS